MARTTADLLKGVIEVDTVNFTDAQLAPFINAANALVTRVCAAQYDENDENDEDLLQQIETWLAAHFYAIRDNRVASESVSGGGSSVTAAYQYKLGLSLQVTLHGQMACTLDTSGRLASLSQQTAEGSLSTVGITWLGKTSHDACDLSEECGI